MVGGAILLLSHPLVKINQDRPNINTETTLVIQIKQSQKAKISYADAGFKLTYQKSQPFNT